MTPKEKAQELFDKYYLATYDTMDVSRIKSKNLAITCALIAVDETLKAAFYSNDEIYNFYIEVKQEIEKL